MNEYAGLKIVSWVLRVVGALLLVGGVAALALDHPSKASDVLLPGALFAFGVLTFAAGDALAALGDIARSSARQAQAAESVASIISSQIAEQRARR